MARIDKLALGSDGYFFRISGSPAVDPSPPANQYGPMSVYQLKVPPYTYTPESVAKESLEVLRKTVWSVNEMQMQIERLKYQAALTEVQKDATEIQQRQKQRAFLLIAWLDSNIQMWPLTLTE